MSLAWVAHALISRHLGLGGEAPGIGWGAGCGEVGVVVFQNLVVPRTKLPRKAFHNEEQFSGIPWILNQRLYIALCGPFCIHVHVDFFKHFCNIHSSMEDHVCDRTPCSNEVILLANVSTSLFSSGNIQLRILPRTTLEMTCQSTWAGVLWRLPFYSVFHCWCFRVVISLIGWVIYITTQRLKWFMVNWKYDIRSNSQSEGKGKTLSRKSEGGEGCVTDALLKKHKSNNTSIKAEQTDFH